MGNNKFDFSSLLPNEWLLVFFYAANNKPTYGKLMLIKQIFILIKEVLPELGPIFEFTPHYYGPHSFDLIAAIEELSKKGLVDIKTSGSRTDYKLTNAGIEAAQKIQQKLPTEVFQKIETFKRSISELSQGGILRYVYGKYPEYTQNSLIRESVENGIQ